jgi:hypothetical protein
LPGGFKAFEKLIRSGGEAAADNEPLSHEPGYLAVIPAQAGIQGRCQFE